MQRQLDPRLCALLFLVSGILASEANAEPRLFEELLGLRGSPVVQVAGVEPGWTAERVGIRTGDLIVAFNDRRLREFTDYKVFLSELRQAALQNEAKLDLLRYQPDSGSYVPQRLIVVLRPADSSDRSQVNLGMAGSFTYFVQEVSQGRTAARLGVTPGDFVEEVNGQRLESPRAMDAMVDAAALSRGEVTFRLLRWRPIDGGKVRGDNPRVVRGTLH